MREIVFYEKQRVKDDDKHREKFLKLIPSLENRLKVVIDMYNLEETLSIGQYKDYKATGMPLLQHVTYASTKGDILHLTAFNRRFDGGFCANNYVYDPLISSKNQQGHNIDLIGFVRFKGSTPSFIINIEDQLSHYSGQFTQHRRFDNINIAQANEILSLKLDLDHLPFTSKSL